MLNQRRFEEPPMAIGEKKQVVVLKLDCSGSMSYDDKIRKLNEAVCYGRSSKREATHKSTYLRS